MKRDLRDSEDEDFARKTAFLGREKVKQETLYQFLKRRTKSTIQRSLKAKQDTSDAYIYTHNQTFTATPNQKTSSFDQTSAEFRQTLKSTKTGGIETQHFRTLSPSKLTPNRSPLQFNSAEIDLDNDKPEPTHKKHVSIDESFEKSLASIKISTRRPNLNNSSLKDGVRSSSKSPFLGFSPRKLSHALRSDETALTRLISDLDNSISETVQKAQNLLSIVEKTIGVCEKSLQIHDSDLLKVFDDIKIHNSFLKKSLEHQNSKAQQGWELTRRIFENFEGELNQIVEECSLRTKKLLESEKMEFQKELSRLKAEVSYEKLLDSTIEPGEISRKRSFKIEDQLHRLSSNFDESMFNRRMSVFEQQNEALREECLRKDELISRLENELEKAKFDSESLQQRTLFISEQDVRSHHLFTKLEERVILLQGEVAALRDIERHLRDQINDNKLAEKLTDENLRLKTEIACKEREKVMILEKLEELTRKNLIRSPDSVIDIEQQNIRLKTEIAQKEREKNQTVERLEQVINEKQRSLASLKVEFENSNRAYQKEISILKEDINQLKRENTQLLQNIEEQIYDRGSLGDVTYKRGDLLRKYDNKKFEAHALWSLLKELKLSFDSEKFTSYVRNLLRKNGLEYKAKAKLFMNHS